MAKKSFIGFILFFVLFQVKSQETIKIPEKANKILFLGNSITYSGQYISYIETYLTLKYPEKKLEFINVGLPSETVSGLSEHNHAQGKFPRPDLKERLHRVLSKAKPDFVFANYGINDGIYLPFDNERFKKFKDGILWMHNEVAKSGAEIVHLTPPVYDGPNTAVYDNVMDIYSHWLLSKRYTDEWKIIDIHSPMKGQLQKERVQNPKFTFAPDGVHPNKEGHWVMAQQVLLSLGENTSAQFNSIEEAITEFENGKKALELIEKRQAINKDAWLSAIGHERTGMTEGMSLKEAQLKSKKLKKQLTMLLNQ
ncbi:SGNH/GDSL hydrolase family protein [Maribacter sp. HTCC2170]|uniref:SGNH/GDSL hydrolase family protein n=1 Tax=Maribacter sp. (strain HTCC2170 / KCCM 42371) TaxID=313603 RepID=UPI0002F70145|nr:SGNH/GDSL hydrolase family protein [Maribacter sp. HTCC2170]